MRELRGERSAAPLKRAARNPRQEACLSQQPPQLYGLRLRRHSRSLGARGCAPPSASLGLPAGPPRAAPPQGPPLPPLPPPPQRKVRTPSGWAATWAAFQRVRSRSHGDRRERGWASGALRLERKKARSGAVQPVRSGHPPHRCPASGFVPLAAASSHPGCHGLGWPRTPRLSAQNNFLSGRVGKWPPPRDSREAKRHGWPEAVSLPPGLKSSPAFLPFSHSPSDQAP